VGERKKTLAAPVGTVTWKVEVWATRSNQTSKTPARKLKTRSVAEVAVAVAVADSSDCRLVSRLDRPASIVVEPAPGRQLLGLKVRK
jgi:hypothetical protein